MQEEYLLKKMIKGKTEQEKEIELLKDIAETKKKLKNARNNFEYAEEDMIDYYIFQIKANQSKLDYLIKIAKKKGIILSRNNEISFPAQSSGMKTFFSYHAGPLYSNILVSRIEESPCVRIPLPASSVEPGNVIVSVRDGNICNPLL